MITAIQRSRIRPLHPFPARMAPSIVWDSLPSAGRPLRILDPMSGSGTTLVCARAKGHHAIGCDTDPLARIISRTWCSDINSKSLKARALDVLDKAMILAKRLNHINAYPHGADEETRKFIDFWFDDENRIQLTALCTCIRRLRSESDRILLWCAFSRLIITKSAGVSLAIDVSHSRPHKYYTVAPTNAFDSFLKAVDYLAKNSVFLSKEPSEINPPVDVRVGDARSLPVQSKSVDMIITSPPYLNAIDYLRGHKLSLVWMGYAVKDIRRLRSHNIGSEVSKKYGQDTEINFALQAMVNSEKLDDRRIGMLKRYAHDLDNVLAECSRVLKKGGRALFVVGNSTVQGEFIDNAMGITQLGNKHNLILASKTVRPLEENKRYLPPPTSGKAGANLQARMREEIILEFITN